MGVCKRGDKWYIAYSVFGKRQKGPEVLRAAG
jgi:hypothetical protein